MILFARQEWYVFCKITSFIDDPQMVKPREEHIVTTIDDDPKIEYKQSHDDFTFA